MSRQVNKLRFYRLRENLTQEELGEIIGVSGRAVGFYETGEREPRLSVAKELADLFGTTIEDLFLS